MDKLMSYAWPGNIREVRSLVERMLLTTTHDLIRVADLPQHISGLRSIPGEGKHSSLKSALEFHEKRILLAAYEQYKTTVGVAEALGISQPSAARKLTKYKKESAR